VIRKHIGYGHIPGKYAERVQKFYTAHFNPYLNFHRPLRLRPRGGRGAGQAAKGVRSQDYMTPYEKLKSLPRRRSSSSRASAWSLWSDERGRIERHRVGTEDAPGQAVLLRAVKLESPTAPRD